MHVPGGKPTGIRHLLETRPRRGRVVYHAPPPPLICTTLYALYAHAHHAHLDPLVLALSSLQCDISAIHPRLAPLYLPPAHARLYSPPAVLSPAVSPLDVCWCTVSSHGVYSVQTGLPSGIAPLIPFLNPLPPSLSPSHRIVMVHPPCAVALSSPACVIFALACAYWSWLRSFPHPCSHLFLLSSPLFLLPPSPDAPSPRCKKPHRQTRHAYLSLYLPLSLLFPYSRPSLTYPLSSPLPLLILLLVVARCIAPSPAVSYRTIWPSEAVYSPLPAPSVACSRPLLGSGAYPSYQYT